MPELGRIGYSLHCKGKLGLGYVLYIVRKLSFTAILIKRTDKSAIKP